MRSSFFAALALTALLSFPVWGEVPAGLSSEESKKVVAGVQKEIVLQAARGNSAYLLSYQAAGGRGVVELWEVKEIYLSIGKDPESLEIQLMGRVVLRSAEALPSDDMPVPVPVEPAPAAASQWFIKSVDARNLYAFVKDATFVSLAEIYELEHPVQPARIQLPGESVADFLKPAPPEPEAQIPDPPAPVIPVVTAEPVPAEPVRPSPTAEEPPLESRSPDEIVLTAQDYADSLAAFQKKYYDALIRNGFSEDQAMQLLLKLDLKNLSFE